MSEKLFIEMLDSWLKSVREDRYTDFDGVDFESTFIGDEKDGELYIKFINVQSNGRRT